MQESLENVQVQKIVLVQRTSLALQGGSELKIVYNPQNHRHKFIFFIFFRRAFDVAASVQGIKVYLNGKKIPVKNFQDYVNLFLKGHEDETGAQIKCIYEKSGERYA